MSKVVRFDDLPLGARFRYLSSKESWVKLEGHGSGLVVRFVPMGSPMPQAVCSAADDEAGRAALKVDWCDPIYKAPPAAVSAGALPTEDPYHPNVYRPIFREVMSGADRLGHLVTSGYDDHDWTFRPDLSFDNRRPTSAKSADPSDALPNWVRRLPYKILSVEETAEIYQQMKDDGVEFSAHAPCGG